MSLWSAIVRAVSDRGGDKKVTAAGVLRDGEGWYYEESQNFSRSQSTVRIEQRRPGEWEVAEPSCGIVGLNKPARQGDVASFFAGSYRWLQLERDRTASRADDVIKVIGTYRDRGGRERSVHLGFLKQELAEDLQDEDLRNLWGRIRFIRFPTPGRDSKYLIRFDLMRRRDVRRMA